MAKVSWFTCPSCLSRFNWLPAQAGKRVRCKCGVVLRIPTEADQAAQLLDPPTPKPAKPVAPEPSPSASGSAAADDDVYELNLDTEPSTPGHSQSSSPRPSSAASSSSSGPRGRCTNCGQKMSLDAVLCVQCGTFVPGHSPAGAPAMPGPAGAIELAVDESALPDNSPAPLSGGSTALKNIRKKYEAELDMEQEVHRAARFKDLYLPLILIAAGIVFSALYITLFTPPKQVDTYTYLNRLALLVFALVKVTLNTVLLFVGLLVVVKLFSAAVGNITTVLLKLVSIATFSLGAAFMFDWLMNIITEGDAWAAGYIIDLLNGIVFFSVATTLLELDFMETLVLYLSSWLLTLGIMVFAGAMIYSLFV